MTFWEFHLSSIKPPDVTIFLLAGVTFPSVSGYHLKEPYSHDTKSTCLIMQFGVVYFITSFYFLVVILNINPLGLMFSIIHLICFYEATISFRKLLQFLQREEFLVEELLLEDSVRYQQQVQP